MDGIDCRGNIHPLVTGFSKPEFHGFETLAAAEDYIDNKGVAFYNYNIKYGTRKTNPVKGQTAYYAVANSRIPEIRLYY